MDWMTVGRWALILAGMGVAVYVVVAAGMFLGQRHLLYHPGPPLPPPAVAGVPEMRAVTLETADGLKLTAWWAPPPAPDRPVLVHLHGNADNIAARTPRYHAYMARGLGVLAVEYRGFGGNPGTPSAAGLRRDAAAALDFLDGRDIPADRRILYGESLGTGVAVLTAAERPCAALVLEAPFDTLVSVGRHHYPWLPVNLLLTERFPAARAIHRVTAPVLVMIAGNDRLVPPHLGRRLYEAASAPKTLEVFPGAHHLDLYEHGAERRVMAFLADHGLDH